MKVFMCLKYIKNHMVNVHKIQKSECKECGEDQNATVTITIVWYIYKYIQLHICIGFKMLFNFLQKAPHDMPEKVNGSSNYVDNVNR